MSLLEIKHVGFPGLGLNFNINPVAFNLFGKDIYWYGIIIVVAILVAAFYATKEADRVLLPQDTISDLILFGAPAAIICARLYYVLFSWKDYAAEPWKIIAVWEGGLAIYGGVIGAFLTAFIYAKVKKIRFMKIADVCAVAFLIGQAIGRWGNFINVEAYGAATNLFWRMEIIPNEVEFGGKLTGVHPTFLYESLWNLAGFLILFSMRKKKPFTGFLFWGYLLWYGLGRAWIEGLRTDSLMLGNVRVSQLLAGVCIIVSVFVILFRWKSDQDTEEPELAAEETVVLETEAPIEPTEAEQETADESAKENDESQ